MTTNINNDTNKKPIWFKIINFTFLIPIIFWPIVAFGAIFIFDNPSNFFLTFIIFLLIIAYPLYLILLIRLNARLFKINKVAATIFPLTFTTIVVVFVLNFIGGPSVLFQFLKQIGTKPQSHIDYSNVIGFNYHKDSTNLYYGDSLVKNADLTSFELINFSWAKDKNKMYYKGNSVSKIDCKTFIYIGSGYSKDTNHVFYDTIIVDKADRNSFYYDSESQEGKDENYCYSKGQNIECSKLQTK